MSYFIAKDLVDIGHLMMASLVLDDDTESL